MTIETFDTREALDTAVTAACLTALSTGLSERGRASLICSGGSTPGPVYKRLSEEDLDWSNVNVGLADERWAPAHSEASNEKLLRETLLVGKAALAKFEPMKTSHPTAAEAVGDVSLRYAAMAAPFDVVVLGMGVDGHTLSWFPGAEGVRVAMDEDADSLATYVIAKRSKVTGENLERMTLTARAIQDARLVVLMITGDEKREVYETGPGYLPVRLLTSICGDRLRVMWAP